ncbi:MAG: FAD-binding oxidoreductase [Rhodobacteraceae bacterium]|nr:FAD-binding oxidoreductase [Paracoccaceae bacterium]
MSDVIVIGGGIAGTSVAARLAPHANVTLLEGEEGLAYHASGRSAALFEESYGAPSVKALNRASAQYHRDGGYLSPRGFLLLGTDENLDLFNHDLSDMAAEEIAVTEACAMVPILDPAKITRAAYHADAQDIDTDRLVQDFAAVVRQNGGQVLTRAQVTEITQTLEGWRVHVGDDTFEASTLVNAAGAWVDHIAALAGVAPLGFTPLRRSMARLPAPGGRDVSRWPMFFGAGESWYAKPDAGKLLVSPAEEDLVEPHDAWAEDMVLAEGIARYQDHVTEDVTRVETTWAGLRTFAPDRVLVLGRDPRRPTFVWCAGQGGYGMQTSPAASQLCADLVLGRRPELDADIVATLVPDRLCTD